MRIALLTPEWYPEDGGGGIATYTRIVARYAAAAGDEVTVFAPTCHAREREQPEQRLDVVPIVVDRGASALAVAEAFRDRWRVEEQTFDAIEAAEFGAVASFIAREAPVVTRLHTPLALLLERNEGSAIYRDDALRCRLEAQQVRESARVLTPTAWLAAEARRLWNVDAEVIPNPVVRPDAPPPARALRAPLRVVYFGRLEHRKGVLTLADAVRPLLSRGEIVVTMAGGDTKWRARSVAARVAEIVAPAFVEILPPRHGDALTALIDDADLVVLPSLFENFAYACVEAMARAKCVVATSGSGFDEILSHGTTGLLVPPGDAEALRDVLAACASGAYDLHAIGQAAWSSLTRFDAPEIVAALRAQWPVSAETPC